MRFPARVRRAARLFVLALGTSALLSLPGAQAARTMRPHASAYRAPTLPELPGSRLHPAFPQSVPEDRHWSGDFGHPGFAGRVNALVEYQGGVDRSGLVHGF